MPRNSSGIYTLPAGNPVTAGTTIDATWANSTLSDIANEITNSLDRYGNGGMLASFRFSDGTVGAPAMSFINETTTGFYRAGTGQMWASVQSTQVAQFTVNGITLPAGKNIAVGGTLTVTGTSAFTGAITATGGVVGNVIGTATNVTGTVAIANGGTGSTTAATARNALLPTQTGNSGRFLTTDGTNISWSAAAPGTVSSVSGTGTVSGLTLTGTVTSSGSLTLGGTLSVAASNFASQTANTVLAAPTGIAGVPTFRALVAADIPTLNQNTTGTASNVTGTVAIANGGTGATTAATARTNLGATTVGSNVLTLTNPSAVTFPRFNADNTVSALDAASFRTAIGAGSGGGSVTSVDVSGGTTGLTASGGPVTASGTITLAGTLAVANGGTGGTSAAAARTNLGGTTVGANLFTLANPSAVRFLQVNADNTVTAQDAATFRTSIGAGTGNGNGSVTSVAMTVPAFLSVTGSPVTTTGTLAVSLSGTALPVANGGTGGTTAATARSALSAAASGANTDITSIASTTTINGFTVGYRDIPQNATSASFQFAQADAGEHFYSTNAGSTTLTVPTNATAAIGVGSAFTVVNNGTTAITISTTGTTVYKAGTSAAWASGGTLAVRGMATFLKVATDTWFVSGSGLS